MTARLYHTVTGTEVRIHVGQTGQKFHGELGRTAFDLTGVTRFQFKFETPSGEVRTKTPTIIDPPVTRPIVDELGNSTDLLVQLEYTVDDPNLFDVAGKWKRWIEIEKPGAYNHRGAPTAFEVFDVGAV